MARPALAMMAHLALLVGGCGPSGPAVTRTVTDSGEPEVVVLSDVPPTTDPSFAWSLVLRRSVRTGSPDPALDPLLFDPRSMTRLDDGTWIVADAGRRPLAIVPSDRDTVSLLFSRVGQGPGELYGGYPVLWPAGNGSFWVADRGNWRVFRFDTTGALLREVPLPSGPGATSLSLIPRQITNRLFSQRYTLPEGSDDAAGAHASLPWTSAREARRPWSGSSREWTRRASRFSGITGHCGPSSRMAISSPGTTTT